MARWLVPIGTVVALGGFFALPAAAGAAAATLYVGGAGCSDSGSGTIDQPFCTISRAATVATAGQTVLVSSGSYAGPVTVRNSGAAGSPITFQPAPGASVTVSGGSNGFALSSRSYVVVRGFRIAGTTSYGISVSSSDHITLDGNTVTAAGHPVQGQIAAGIVLSGATSSLVTGNHADNNSDSGIVLKSSTTGTTVSYNEASGNANGYQRNANGINVIAAGNTVIGNVLHDNEDSGLQFYPGGNNNLAAVNVSYNNGDHGIDDLNVTGGRLIGNTIYHNCTSGINVEGTSGNYLVENNIAVDNAVYPAYHGISCNRRAGNIGIWDSAPATTTVNSNLVYLTKSGTMYVFGTSYASLAAMQAATGQERTGLQADPRFAGASSGNLQLLGSSPAIDSADSGASGEQPTDALGAGRVDIASVPNTGLGPRPYDDRGAYEFGGAGVPDQPPAARLSVTPASGTAPLAVTASGSGSSDPQGQALQYRFDFGDGTVVGPQSSATATHTYAAPGTYSVVLTVTNTSGLSSTASASVTVSPASGNPPVARLSVTPSSGVAPLAVTASGSGSSDPQGQALQYRFDFGDGTVVGPQSSATATHTYAAAGTYSVVLTVTDTDGLSSTASASVSVSASGGGTAASYVSQIATNYSTSPHTSGSITVWRTGGVAAGHLMVLAVELTGTSAGAVTGTDSVGDRLSVASDVLDAAGHRLVVLYGVSGGLAVNQTISASFPSAATYRIVGDDVAGPVGLDGQASAAGTGSAFSSGPASAAGAGEFVFTAAGAFAASGAPTWAGGWTGLSSYAIGTDYLARAYRISTAAGSFTGSGTTSGSSWLAATATFR